MSAPCPAGCGREHRPGELLCKDCWFSVSRRLRTEVNRTWHAYRRALRAKTSSRLMVFAADEYRVASDRAIASAREQLIRKEMAR